MLKSACKGLLYLAGVGALLGGVGQAEISTIHTGFGEADSFNTAVFSTIQKGVADGVAVDVSQARAFIVPSEGDFYLHSIEIAVTTATGSRELEVRVLGNDGTVGPLGAPDESLVLEHFQVKAGPWEDPPGRDSILLIPSGKGPRLRAGAKYWLALSVETPEPPTVIQWWGTAPGLRPGPTLTAKRANFGVWDVAHVAGPGQAFRINATPIPAHVSSSYTFTKIVDTSGPVRRLDSSGTISVDSAGTVVFWAELDDGVQGVFKGGSGPITAIADSRGPFLDLASLSPFSFINSKGTVVLLGRLNSGTHSIFIGNGKYLKLVTDESGPFHTFGPPAMNSSATVVFLAALDGQGGGIFTIGAGKVTMIAHTSGPFSGFDDRPSINDKGTVAFAGQLDSGTVGIFKSQRGAITTIADTSRTFTAFGVPAINDRGTVAFWGCLDSQRPSCPAHAISTQGLFTGNGGPLTTVADSSGPYRAFGNLALNNNGAVAFVALLDSGDTGIFTGPDPATDAIIFAGDQLSGSRVESIELVQEVGLNDAGQVAFFIRLADGSRGLYLATPKPGT